MSMPPRKRRDRLADEPMRDVLSYIRTRAPFIPLA